MSDSPARPTTSPVALVTGAARGLGLEVARQLGEQGYATLVAARDVAVARVATEGMTGVTVLDVPLDVSDPHSVTAAAAAVRAHPRRLDVLVNNAAAFVDWTESATGADLDEAEHVMAVNLFGPWRMAQAFLPLLAASAHPRLVNVSSGGGSHADEQFGLTRRGGAAASYGISKAALNALTATLAAELAGSPVLVNAVCPGLTATYDGAEAMGARSVQESARSVLWAVMLPDDGPRGGFFRDGRPLGW